MPYISEERTPSGVITSWKPRLCKGHYRTYGSDFETYSSYYTAKPFVVKKQFPDGTVLELKIVNK